MGRTTEISEMDTAEGLDLDACLPSAAPDVMGAERLRLTFCNYRHVNVEVLLYCHISHTENGRSFAELIWSVHCFLREIKRDACLQPSCCLSFPHVSLCSTLIPKPRAFAGQKRRIYKYMGRLPARPHSFPHHPRHWLVLVLAILLLLLSVARGRRRPVARRRTIVRCRGRRRPLALRRLAVCGLLRRLKGCS